MSFDHNDVVLGSPWEIEWKVKGEQVRRRCKAGHMEDEKSRVWGYVIDNVMKFHQGCA